MRRQAMIYSLTSVQARYISFLVWSKSHNSLSSTSIYPCIHLRRAHGVVDPTFTYYKLVTDFYQIWVALGAPTAKCMKLKQGPTMIMRQATEMIGHSLHDHIHRIVLSIVVAIILTIPASTKGALRESQGARYSFQTSWSRTRRNLFTLTFSFRTWELVCCCEYAEGSGRLGPSPSLNRRALRSFDISSNLSLMFLILSKSCSRLLSSLRFLLRDDTALPSCRRRARSSSYWLYSSSRSSASYATCLSYF